MNTNPTLQDRAVEAAARFLEVRGYETLATTAMPIPHRRESSIRSRQEEGFSKESVDALLHAARLFCHPGRDVESASATSSEDN